MSAQDSQRNHDLSADELARAEAEYYGLQKMTDIEWAADQLINPSDITFSCLESREQFGELVDNYIQMTDLLDDLLEIMPSTFSNSHFDLIQRTKALLKKVTS